MSKQVDVGTNIAVEGNPVYNYTCNVLCPMGYLLIDYFILNYPQNNAHDFFYIGKKR